MKAKTPNPTTLPFKGSLEVVRGRLIHPQGTIAIPHPIGAGNDSLADHDKYRGNTRVIGVTAPTKNEGIPQLPAAIPHLSTTLLTEGEGEQFGNTSDLF